MGFISSPSTITPARFQTPRMTSANNPIPPQRALWCAALICCLFSPFGQALGATQFRAVTLSWDANTETDVAGYKLRYGTTSGVYTQTLPNVVGRTNTHVSVLNLDINGDYYFVVSAYNAAGLESTASNQAVTLHGNANLASLAVTDATLTPSFSSSVQSYTAAVPASTASVALTPTPADGAATVSVNGVDVAPDSSSASIPLVVGTTTVTTVVTAPDGVTKKTSTVKVIRAAPPTVGTFNIGGAIFSVNEEAGTIDIPVTRTGGTTGSVTLKFSTTNGTATSPTDFTAVTSQDVTFADGDGVTKNVTITIANPLGTIEPNETFTVTISNPPGATVPFGPQKTATVVIRDSVDTTNPGTPVITTPLANALVNVNPGGPVTVTGTVADNQRVGTVEVRLDGGAFVPAAVTLTGTGAAFGTTATYTVNVIPAAGGTHTVQVRTTDARGNVSAALASRTFTVLRPLQVNITGNGTVTAGFAPTSFREIGKSYTITATPTPAAAPGFAFNGWTVNNPAGTGITPPKQELPTLTFTFQEGLVLTANFIPNPFTAALTGAFNGLILPSPTLPAPGASVRSNETVGKVTTTVGGTGAFSGTLFIDGLSLGFAGVFDNTGTGRFGTNRATTFTVVRTTKPSYELTLHLDFAPADSNKMTGFLTQKIRGIIESISDLNADRAYYNATAPKVPANLAGTASKAYTVVFPSKGLGSQPAGFTLADYPQGDGYATATVYVNGTVSVVGKLADGTPISASAPLSKANTWPLFQPLYGPVGATKGCIAGQVKLDDVPADSDMKQVAGTNLLWFRPFQLVQWYPYGWDEGILVDLIGAKYVVPPATPATSVFPGPGPASALKAADPVNGNAGLTFSDGLLSGPITRSVNISPTNVATRPTSNTDTSFTLTIPASGIVTGVFTHTDGTKPAFEGVIIQKGTQRGAYGYFLTKQPAVIDYTGQSGGVTALAK